MIISGLQTGNTRWLAAHLQNVADNETIELAEVTGTVATDIDGALAEFDAITAGTRAKEGVYAAFINPPVPLSSIQYIRAIDHIAERLGLAGQPRLVVFHVKKGREHCHVVWSRIDAKRMRAIQLSFDRQTLRRCAKELARLFGLGLPPGLAEDRGLARYDDPPHITRAEKAMQARSGLDRDERRAVITACWRGADGPNAFMQALEAAGFLLARGDKRGYVVIDRAGDAHALARQIDGVKTKDVRQRLQALPLSALPSVERGKALMLQRVVAEQDTARAKAKKEAAAREARLRVHRAQKQRQSELDQLWQRMQIRHAHERKVLLAHLRAEKDRRDERRQRRALGLALYLRKIAFLAALLAYYEKRKRRAYQDWVRSLLAAMRRRHEHEAAELRRRREAMARLAAREMATLATMTGSVGAGRKGLVMRSYARERYGLIAPAAALQFAPACPVRFEARIAAELVRGYRPPAAVVTDDVAIDLSLPSLRKSHGLGPSGLAELRTSVRFNADDICRACDADAAPSPSRRNKPPRAPPVPDGL